VRVVLVDALLDLADEVLPNILLFGVDAALDPLEELDGGLAETETLKDLHKRFVKQIFRLTLHHEVNTGEPGEPQPHHGETHNTALSELNLEPVIQGSFLALYSGSNVSLGLYRHTLITRQLGQELPLNELELDPETQEIAPDDEAVHIEEGDLLDKNELLQDPVLLIQVCALAATDFLLQTVKPLLPDLLPGLSLHQFLVQKLNEEETGEARPQLRPLHRYLRSHFSRIV